MNAPVVVGTDGSGSALDAVALAVRFARSIDTRLVVACVYPGAPADGRVPDQVSAALDAARELVGAFPADFRTVASSSAARGLTELAENEGASVLIAGSSERGAFGRVLSGSTAVRLLHGTAVPVAVAPRGYRRRGTKPFHALGVAFVGSPEGHKALDVAAELARRAGVPLTVYEVLAVEQSWFTPQAAAGLQPGVPEEVREEYERALEEAVAAFRDGIDVTGQLLVGSVVDELSAVDEDGIDLLVCGSRGYGAGAAGAARICLACPSPPSRRPGTRGAPRRRGPRLSDHNQQSQQNQTRRSQRTKGPLVP